MMTGVYIQEKDIKFWTSIVFENHYPYRNLGNYPLPEGGHAYENVSKPRKDKKWLSVGFHALEYGNINLYQNW